MITKLLLSTALTFSFSYQTLAIDHNKIESSAICKQPASLLRGTMKVNNLNHLEIGGIDVAMLAKKSKYAIYIIDEQLVRDNMRSYIKSMKEYYSNPGHIFYATKALMTEAICKIAEKEGMGLDVSTEGELYTAIKARFPMNRVILHGNNKSEEEIEMALKAGVGRIVIDNLNDIDLLGSLSNTLNKEVHVLVRVKPGIFAHTHSNISTAHNESKFGFIIDNGAAEVAIAKIKEHSNLKFDGIHVHIGSQLLEMDDYSKAIDLITAFMKKLADQKIAVKELDFGGGLGVVYNCSNKKIEIKDFVKQVADHLTNNFKKEGLPLPLLMLEPGRSIIAEAGTTVYKIGSTKTVDTGQTYAAVNGGMGDNIRTALYQAKYHAVMANKVNDELTESVKIVGKNCETGDIVIEDILLPRPERGDILAVFSTGAYNYTMASHYNRVPIPGVLLVKDGKADWIVKPEGMEEIVRDDVLPKRMK